MTHLYYLIIIILTGITSSLMTSYLPTLKNVYRRTINKIKNSTVTFYWSKKPTPTTTIEEIIKPIVAKEVEKQLKEILKDDN